jgi:hypothetical protein
MSSSVTNIVSPEGFTWSYSLLKDFEVCPKRMYHYKIAKDVTEPQSDAITQGNALHEAFRARVAENKPLPLGMRRHEAALAKLASAPGEVACEQKLALNEKLKPTGFFSKDVWFRIVLDYTNVRGAQAAVMDYKTGKPADDPTQLRLSALALFQQAPELERVKTMLWFTNYDVTCQMEFARRDTTTILDKILPRVGALADARRNADYPAKPGPLCRRWCAVKSCPHHGA